MRMRMKRRWPAVTGILSRPTKLLGWLLGICFTREAPERAIGTNRRAGKRGGIPRRCSMSKGGGGGRGGWMRPSQRPWRRRRNSTCSGRLTAPASFMGALQHGKWTFGLGSPPAGGGEPIHGCLQQSVQRSGVREALLAPGGSGSAGLGTEFFGWDVATRREKSFANPPALVIDY